MAFRANSPAPPQFLRGKPDVLNHEYFREICAAASIGQATPEELAELEKHTQACEGCQQAYFDYLNLAAEQFAAANCNTPLSPQESKGHLNSDLFTQGFLQRAQAEGIRFSPEVRQNTVRQSTTRQGICQITPRMWHIPRRIVAQSVAALLLLGLGLSTGYFYGRRAGKANLEAATIGNDRGPIAIEDPARHAAELTEANGKLQVEIDRLRMELAKSGDRLQATETNLRFTREDRKKLASDRAQLQAQLKGTEDALAQSQLLASSAQDEAVRNREQGNAAEAALATERVKISDLTDELEAKSAALDKETQLLALNHDVSDLMGARNLHIVDVVDTDPRGKTRPSFGRVFFTEGKSLVFYAYDLNEAKIQKANYQYRVWAKQEGGHKQVRSLGIFYSDDKAQRRWVFKCNDAKVLRVIDSVFVTLEPANGDPSQPKGPNLMYAYLWSQPNHP